jgi:Glycosyl transferase family 11
MKIMPVAVSGSSKTNMIIVRLNGGLGNQMFQYALGRKMSIKNGDVLKFDLSVYTPGNKRTYELGGFNIVGMIASPDEIKRIKLPHGLISEIIIWFKKHVLRIFNIEFRAIILDKKGDMYLDGFWQSEKYFLDIRNILLKDFTLKNSLKDSSVMVLEKIKNTSNSVSLHVRRGDYIKEKTTNAYWGTCNPDYYNQAMTVLKNKIGLFTLFVFSDDIGWVKKNMQFNFPTIFVSGYNITNYEELALMASCEHNIIANSSFSWWGAWLNQNPQKIVIAPKQWQIKAKSRAKDIVPNSWIKI